MRQAFLKTKEELMLNYQKSMFSEDEERRPLLTEPELYDACLRAAATIITAYALGCEFEDCRLDDDGRRWPVSLSVVEIKYPASWRGSDAFTSVAMIHEAGSMAVAKRHGRGPHRIDTEGRAGLIDTSLVRNASALTEASGAPNHLHNPAVMAALRTSRTATLLDVPLIGAAIEALAQFIEDNYEGDGCYGALGTNYHAPGEESAAIKLIKEMGITPGWRWFDGRIGPPRLRPVT